MKTDIIMVSSKGSQMEIALKQVEKVAAYKDLSPKATLHLRLLAEEMMGMMRSITGETEGEFWIEDQDSEFQLHLRVAARLTPEKREQLLSASSTGKNESAKGLMGRLRAFFDWSCDLDTDGLPGYMLLPDAYEHYSTAATLEWEWSMQRYEAALNAQMQSDSGVQEAWDELEKSVVKHVADDVKVAIRGGTVEMIIIKKLA